MSVPFLLIKQVLPQEDETERKWILAVIPLHPSSPTVRRQKSLVGEKEWAWAPHLARPQRPPMHSQSCDWTQGEAPPTYFSVTPSAMRSWFLCDTDRSVWRL